MQKPSRPTGVAILAILELIGGVIGLLLGILLIGVGGSGILSSFGFGLVSGIVAAVGGIIVVVSVLVLILGWGMWTGKSWAWTIAVILYILGVLSGIGSLAVGALTGVVGLVISILILWYLWRPHVRAFFGHGTQPAPMPQPAPPTTT